MIYERGRIRTSLVVGGDNVGYNPEKLSNLVDHFLGQEKFQRSSENRKWDGIGAEKFSLEPFSDSGFDAWPDIYVLGEMQSYNKWAGGLKFDDITTVDCVQKRVLILVENGPKKYSFGDLWTLSCKFRDYLQMGSGLRDDIPGASEHHLVFDDGKIAAYMSSFEGIGYSKFCKIFGIDH